MTWGGWTAEKLPPLDSPLGDLDFGEPLMRRYLGSDDFRDWRDEWEWHGGAERLRATLRTQFRKLANQPPMVLPTTYVVSPGWYRGWLGLP